MISGFWYSLDWLCLVGKLQGNCDLGGVTYR
jgi:hypothetical protein